MRKVLFLLTVLYSTYSIAQTSITNGDMENWQNVGSATEEPFQWNSNRTGGGNAPSGPQTLFRESSNPHGGQYCARVRSGSTLGIVVNGALATGRVEAPSFNKSEGYIRTIAGDPNYAMPFTGRPDSLIFWFRSDMAGSDFPRVEARLHVGNAYTPETPVNGNHPDSTVNIIARAQWQGPAGDVASWTRVAVPFIYVDNRTPQYILITTTSSGDQNGGTANSTLWLDDFEVFYQPTVTVGSIQPLTYYVSANQGSTITIPYSLLGVFGGGNTVTAQLSDANGSFANSVTIGSVTSTISGTINGTIPAATPNGNAYRVQLITTAPGLTSAPNNANITIVNVSNSIAPAATQSLTQGTAGTALTVTETPGASSRVWKVATTSGGPYQPIVPQPTGISYTPQFATGGTFYVVCESSYPGGVTVTSNEVQFDVIGNSVTPAAPQSVGTNISGTTLTVTETSPASAREWKFATTSGGPYQSFNPAQTGTTYTPLFTTSGTYFIVCESIINGETVVSNEVEIDVSTPFLFTGAIAGSPFLFSPSAPNANIAVPYYTTSAIFDYTNEFFAQLSDANGSFANPVVIGSKQDTATGVINAIIPSSTPAGTGYRIRVVSSSPAINGANNGVDLIVDQFNNSISPAAPQTFTYFNPGSPLLVSASQTSVHEWRYSTTSGSGYQSFSPPATGNIWVPNFDQPGVYYVVCYSVNQYNDTVVSNEVEITVLNGTNITTTLVTGSPYLVSPSANEQATVTFTSDAVFESNNVFTVELSDNNGTFNNPVSIGTLSGNTISPITVNIPNGSVGGDNYRIRVVSSHPPIIGTDNGVDLEIIPFEIAVTPLDTQTILPGQSGNVITITETHPCTREWQWSEVSGLGFAPFIPAQTGIAYVPKFNQAGTYYVICRSQNQAGDVLNSQEITIIVTAPNSLSNTLPAQIGTYWEKDVFTIDLSQCLWSQAHMELLNLSGQLIVSQELVPGTRNSIKTNVQKGLYIVRLLSNEGTYNAKIMKWQ